jgi:hypothetical protein
MSTNEVISAINQLSTDYEPNLNDKDLIVIDTLNNRIGIGTQDPVYDIDISTNNTNNLRINNIIIDGSNSKIVPVNSSPSNYIKIPRVIVNDISTMSINTGDISFTSDDITFRKNVYIDSSLIVQDISVINRLDVREISAIYINSDALSVTSVTSDDTTTQGLVITSDDRLKHNEENIVDALSIINKLQPKKYEKTKTFLESDYVGPLDQSYRIEAGLIAQDVAEIPQLKFSVIPGDNVKPYNLNYNDVFVYGIAATQQLDKKVDTNFEVLKQETETLVNSLIDISNSQVNILELSKKIENIDEINNTNTIKTIEESKAKLDKTQQDIQILTSKMNIIMIRLDRLERAITNSN